MDVSSTAKGRNDVRRPEPSRRSLNPNRQGQCLRPAVPHLRHGSAEPTASHDGPVIDVSELAARVQGYEHEPVYRGSEQPPRRGHHADPAADPERLKSRLDAENAHMEVAFPYFAERTAPVSGATALMDYQCRFTGEANGGKEDFVLSVCVPVTSLCPRSKAIGDYGAHNQRGQTVGDHQKT